MTVSAARAVAVEIEGRALGHRYGRRTVFEGLEFRLAAPAVVIVAGPNGAGKSTLLRIMAGLLRPSAGTVRLEMDGQTLDDGGRRRHVGYAAPELHFYDEMTAAENLRFAAEARGDDAPAARVAESLERVGLAARAGDRVTELSSGMKQRLRLAFAILHRPAVLLLDEPGSHLDDAGRAVVRSLVTEWARERLVVLATNEESEKELGAKTIQLRHGLGSPA